MLKVRKALSIQAWDVFYNDTFLVRFDLKRQAIEERNRLLKILS